MPDNEFPILIPRNVARGAELHAAALVLVLLSQTQDLGYRDLRGFRFFVCGCWDTGGRGDELVYALGVWLRWC